MEVMGEGWKGGRAAASGAGRRVFRGENVDGKTVTLVCWSAAKIEFLHRAFVDIGHALNSFR